MCILLEQKHGTPFPGVRWVGPRSRPHPQASESAARSGSGSPADWIAARESVAQLQQTLLGVEAERQNARLTLARWTGSTPDQPLAAPPDLASSPIGTGDVSERLTHHPELLRLSAQEAAMAAEAEVARQEREPDWSTELILSLRGSGYLIPAEPAAAAKGVTP